MASDNKNKGFEKPDVDEDYLMNVISGDEAFTPRAIDKNPETQNEDKPRAKVRSGPAKNGKVVYIRPEYHERLLRLVQLTREEKTTLYSYIDNILEHHFREFGEDITNYFNERFKPIL
jgi:hypothetical protein